MNKTVKMILAAAGALVLGGVGEGIGAELLKKVAKNNDAAEDTNEDATVTAEESEVVETEEIHEDTTED